MAAVIGALRADLSAGWAEFRADMGKAADSVRDFSRTWRGVAADMRGLGTTMTAALTVPIAAFVGSSVRAGSDFEAAMNRVEAATGAAGEQLERLERQARAIGIDPNATANAIEAADAMEVLAKNGVPMEQILGGATAASLLLASATGTALAPAADLTTDVMQQFGVAAGDLTGVVDRVTGTLLVSKFGFEDYALALGQAGGVAGGLGVEFDDFNAVIAATGSLFSSGSDAGTSFKTFLQRLPGTSNEAARAIEAYGLSFYNADGSMRSMAEIAEELRTKLGNLNDQAKSEVLSTIFGTDAMRTAIGLMNEGADGLNRLNEQIQAASASDQMNIRLRGLEAATRDFRRSMTELGIAVAQSGLLDFLTSMAQAAASLARDLAQLDPVVLQIGVAIAGIVAIAGPLLFVMGAFAGAVANLAPLAAGAGVAFTAFSRVLGVTFAFALRAIAPMMAALVLQLSVQFPAAAAAAGVALTALRTAMAFLMGPWGIAILAIAAAVGVLVWQMTQAPRPTRQTEQAITALEESTRAYEEAVNAASIATGEGAAAAREAAREARRLAAERRLAAKAALVQARAELALVQAMLGRARMSLGQSTTERGDVIAAGHLRALEQREDALQASETAAEAAIAEADRRMAAADAALAASTSGGGGGDIPTDPGQDLGGGGGDRGRRGRQGPTVEDLEREHAMAVARAQNNAMALDALEDQEEVQRRIRGYEEAGLSNAAARTKAEGEVAELARLRAEEYARVLAEMAEADALTVAGLANDYARTRELERARDVRQRTLEYQRNGVALAEAERKALADIAVLEAARADAARIWLEQGEQALQLRLAQARGDTAEADRLQSIINIRERALELQRDGLMTPEAAQAQAEAEDAQARLAEMVGRWRHLSTTTYRNAYNEGIRELNALLDAGEISLEEYQRGVRELGDELNRGLAETDPVLGQWADSVDAFGDSLMAAFKPGADLGDIWEAFRLELLKILVLQPLLERMKQTMRDWGSGIGGGSGGGLFGGGGGGGWLSTALNIGSRIFGGFRARGGGVTPSAGYVVGEEGPELFFPSVAGSIVPNDALTAGPAGGGLNVTNIIHADDAVLTSWVRKQVEAGTARAIQAAVPMAVGAAREVVPEEMARTARDTFV